MIELMGRSEKMTILIEGENGEGKEYMMVKSIPGLGFVFEPGL